MPSRCASPDGTLALPPSTACPLSLHGEIGCLLHGSAAGQRRSRLLRLARISRRLSGVGGTGNNAATSAALPRMLREVRGDLVTFPSAVRHQGPVPAAQRIARAQFELVVQRPGRGDRGDRIVADEPVGRVESRWPRWSFSEACAKTRAGVPVGAVVCVRVCEPRGRLFHQAGALRIGRDDPSITKGARSPPDRCSRPSPGQPCSGCRTPAARRVCSRSRSSRSASSTGRRRRRRAPRCGAPPRPTTRQCADAV